MGAEFGSIDNDLIRIDEQTDLEQLEEEIGNKNPSLFNAIKKWQKAEVDLKNSKEKVLYITKTTLDATKIDFNIEKLEENITDTYEIFQGTKLAENLGNTENLQNVAEMIDDFSENILFTGDNPIIYHNYKPTIRKNLITGLSMKISELIVSDEDINKQIKGFSEGGVLTSIGNAISATLGNSITENIKQYRTSLEGLNGLNLKYIDNPRDVKNTIDNLIKNNGKFINENNNKYDEDFKKEDLKSIGNKLGKDLINGDLAKNISAIAEINNENSDLSGKQKIKLFFNSSMGEKVKDFFKESPMLFSIISFLLSTFMGINLEKLMGNDKLTEENIPEFRKNIIKNSSDIKNADKLFLTSEGDADLTTSNRLYGIKDLLKYSDDNDLKKVFFDIQGKSEFVEIKKHLTGNVIDSNGTITDHMDDTINLYYDFLTEQKNDKSLTIEQFIDSKKKENKADNPPTENETKDWVEKSPEKKGDYITAIIGIGNHKYETKINKNGTVTIRSNVPESVKYIPENDNTGDLLTSIWDKPKLEEFLNNKDQIIKIIGKTLKGDKSGKFNNKNKIKLSFGENNKLSFTFTKSTINKVESQTSDTKKIIAGTVAGTIIPKIENSTDDNKTTKETKTEGPKEPVITQKTTKEIIEEEKVEKMTLSKMNKKVPDISKDIDIQETYFTLKYDDNYTIRVNNNNSIFVKIKGENEKYDLLEFKNSDSEKIKKSVKESYSFRTFSSTVYKTLRIFLKPIISKINEKVIDLGKSDDGKEDYGELTLQKKYSTEVKTIEESRKELKENKKLKNPEKVKEKKDKQKDNIAYENEKDGITFIRYKNIAGNKMLGKLGDKDFSIELKKISGKNPVIFVKLGKQKFQSEIVNDNDFWTFNTLLSKMGSDKYELKFNGNSEISVDSDADVIGNISGGDFKIDPENLIREINNNNGNQIIAWDKSPTPGTKMLFKKFN